MGVNQPFGRCATTRVDVSCSPQPAYPRGRQRGEINSLGGSHAARSAVPRTWGCMIGPVRVVAWKASVAQIHAIGPVPGSNCRPPDLGPSPRSREGHHVNGRAVTSSVHNGSAVASGINGATGRPGGSSSCAPAPLVQHIKDMSERARVGSGLTTTAPRARYQSSRMTPPPATAVATDQRRPKPRCTHLAASVVTTAASPQQPDVHHGWDADR
jgi:hypothetical protein